MPRIIKDIHPCMGDHCLHKVAETMSEIYLECCLGECDYMERRTK